MSAHLETVGSSHGVHRHPNTINEAGVVHQHCSVASIGSSMNKTLEEKKSSLKCSLNKNNFMKSTGSFNNVTEVDAFPKSFAWDWPFCDDGIARGMYTEEKFFICLPFNGGTGKKIGKTHKFEKISESNFSWTIGLSNSSNESSGASFWRLEIETLSSLNVVALIVSRDISYEGPKRLKRIRKVYRLPQMYDITTLRSTSYDWAIVIEALRRLDAQTNKPIALKRADTFV